MNPILNTILAVVAGVVLGSLVNIGLITLGGIVVPPPEGMDPMDPESIKAFMPMFQPIHFVFPFLAHSFGTLVGALTAALIGAKEKMKFALGIGIFFLAGGIYNIASLPSPVWYSILDLVGAYLPMAWFGWKLTWNK